MKTLFRILSAKLVLVVKRRSINVRAMQHRRVTVTSLLTSRSNQRDVTKASSITVTSPTRRRRNKPSDDVSRCKDDIGVMETHLLTQRRAVTSQGRSKVLVPFRDRKRSCVGAEQLQAKTSLLPEGELSLAPPFLTLFAISGCGAEITSPVTQTLTSLLSGNRLLLFIVSHIHSNVHRPSWRLPRY